MNSQDHNRIKLIIQIWMVTVATIKKRGYSRRMTRKNKEKIQILDDDRFTAKMCHIN